MGVWVVAEIADGAVVEPTLEALGEAVELGRAARPGAVAVGSATAADALIRLGAHGAGRAVLLERDDADAAPEADAAALAAWLATEPPGTRGAPVLLLGETPYGRAVAPVLAARLDAAIAPNAIAVRRAPDGALDVTRPAYGDRLYATVRVAAGVPAVIGLRPGAFGVGPAEAGRAIAVERQPARIPPGLRVSRRRRVIAADPRTVDLRDAERIVAGGRGVGGPEGFRLLAELAELLGAVVGGSRVAVDLGWIPWERQVGQSGCTVAPALYLACGISGASQHLAGIRGARTIVAINTDRAAPILDMAHLGVVGDWQPVVARLAERLRARQDAVPSPPSTPT